MGTSHKPDPVIQDLQDRVAKQEHDLHVVMKRERDVSRVWGSDRVRAGISSEESAVELDEDLQVKKRTVRERTAGEEEEKKKKGQQGAGEEARLARSRQGVAESDA